MRDAVQLTDTSPCLRNVMPFVKARALELLSMYDIESEYLRDQSLQCCYSRIHKCAGYSADQFRPGIEASTTSIAPQVVTQAVDSMRSAAAAIGQYIGLYSEERETNSAVKMNTKIA
eukprot:4287-Heterococcus_DN1.PRE.1